MNEKTEKGDKKIKIIAFSDSDNREYYDSIIESLLDIHYLNKSINDGNDVYLIYDHFTDKGKQYYDGLEYVFKLDGLIGIINGYFNRRKINLKASKDIYEHYNVIKFEKFIRLDIVEKMLEKEDIGREIIEGEKYNGIFKKR